MLLRVLDRHLFELGHGALDIELRAAGARVRPRKQGALPVLEKVEVERLAETQAEDFQVGVSSTSVRHRLCSHVPSQTDAPSAWTDRIALSVSLALHAGLLEDHGALAGALRPDHEVVAALLLAPEDGVDELLLAADNVARLRRLC